MNTWANIRYRDLWDVPRIFLVEHGGNTYLFDCAFDEATEDYPDHYRVFRVPSLTEDELAGSWDELHLRAIQELGSVPVRDVQFDPTRRARVDTSILARLTQTKVRSS